MYMFIFHYSEYVYFKIFHEIIFRRTSEEDPGVGQRGPSPFRNQKPFLFVCYRSREEECIAKRLKELYLNLTTMDLKKDGNNNVSYFSIRWQRGKYKQCLPLTSQQKRNEGKGQIRPKKFDNCISTNIVTRQSRIKSVKVPEAKSEQYTNSFFVRTA